MSAALAAAVMGSQLAGCGLPTALTGGPKPTWARPFPPGLQQFEVLDMQARRDGYELTLTNSSPERLEASTVWVNQRFSYPLESLDIGERTTLDLRRFVDEYGERFRGGGFFATDDPADVMLVQIETERRGGVELLGLVSVGETPN